MITEWSHRHDSRTWRKNVGDCDESHEYRVLQKGGTGGTSAVTLSLWIGRTHASQTFSCLSFCSCRWGSPLQLWIVSSCRTGPIRISLWWRVPGSIPCLSNAATHDCVSLERQWRHDWSNPMLSILLSVSGSLADQWEHRVCERVTSCGIEYWLCVLSSTDSWLGQSVSGGIRQVRHDWRDLNYDLQRFVDLSILRQRNQVHKAVVVAGNK